MDNKDLFYSAQNQNFTFEQVQKKVQRDTSYDISKNKSLRKNYNKMALLVYENTPDENKNLVNLNNLLVEKSSSYFTKLINNRSNNASNTQSNIQSNDVLPPSVPLPQSLQKQKQQSLLPFTLSDEFIDEVESSAQPIYNNMSTLENNDGRDPMALMKEQQNNRDVEMQRFTKQFEQLKQNSLLTQPNVGNNNNPMSIGRDDALIDTRIDNIQADPLELYRKKEDLTSRMVESMSEHNISGNNIELDATEKGIEKPEILTQKMADDFNNQLYVNTKYSFDRRPAEMVVIEKTYSGTSKLVDFIAELEDTLVIDKHADVFLEFISLQGVECNGSKLEQVNSFALEIEEFNIQTKSNKEQFRNKYIFPNETFGLNDNGGDGGSGAATATAYNIKLKSNYMCTINPLSTKKLTIKLYGYISGTLTLLDEAGSSSITIGLYIKKHM